ncbi:DUF4174 domain-containing protein [Pseudosulfitobacter sp. SM2401]|uniref:DUF4174 domain-containing protein n=1 Tax=Pseudosulfitobacter sp. SM2401 TaxID=3350098 RepID=UPI0036F31543
MKRTLSIVIATLFATCAVAQDTSLSLEDTVFVTQSEANLNEFVWKKRPVVVFADSDADPRYGEQIELLMANLPDLAERDVVVLTDTDPAARSELRTKLRPRGFMLVIIGKDGDVKLRKPLPWDVREISRSIDKMPMRKREIREQRLVPNDG